MGITDKVLDWFSSFLCELILQVRVGIHLSSIKKVTFGVVEGSVLGLNLYNMAADSLIRRIRLPRVAYADVSDLALYGQAEEQTKISIVANCQGNIIMPLSYEKF